jgi:hypothetical protein
MPVLLASKRLLSKWALFVFSRTRKFYIPSLSYCSVTQSLLATHLKHLQIPKTSRLKQVKNTSRTDAEQGLQMAVLQMVKQLRMLKQMVVLVKVTMKRAASGK